MGDIRHMGARISKSNQPFEGASLNHRPGAPDIPPIHGWRNIQRGSCKTNPDDVEVVPPRTRSNPLRYYLDGRVPARPFWEECGVWQKARKGGKRGRGGAPGGRALPYDSSGYPEVDGMETCLSGPTGAVGRPPQSNRSLRIPHFLLRDKCMKKRQKNREKWVQKGFWGQKTAQNGSH